MFQTSAITEELEKDTWEQDSVKTIEKERCVESISVYMELKVAKKQLLIVKPISEKRKAHNFLFPPV